MNTYIVIYSLFSLYDDKTRMLCLLLKMVLRERDGR
jgi:hypothetical protein